MNWLERLNEHGISTISRIEIRVPLNEDAPEENSRRFASYGDFSKLNARWNQAHSSVTHQRLTNNPEEWCFYHTRMRENEKEWLVVPRVECINHLTKNLPLGAVIGDFGAGEAGLARALHDIHTVYSFDHIAIDDSVIQCDMAATGLEPAILDAVVFSLSLMGRNIKDYILEAYRTLKPGGQLIIWHTQSGVDLENFADGLGKLGFAVVQKGPRWKWNYIWAIKEGTQKDIDVELHF